MQSTPTQRCIGDCSPSCTPNMTTAVSTFTDLSVGTAVGGYTIEVPTDIDVSSTKAAEKKLKLKQMELDLL